jgi:uncharacterized protein YkwD
VSLVLTTGAVLALSLTAAAPAEAATNKDATASVAAKPAKAAFRVVAKSSRKQVKVGKRFVIKGKVAPRAPRAKVKLQRKARAGWTTVERDRLSRSSHYTFPRTAHSSGDKQFRVVKVSPRKRAVVRSAVRQIRMVPKRKATPATSGEPIARAESAGLTEREAAVLRLTNELRATGTHCGGQWYGPTSPLRANANLTEAARAHAEDMVAKDYFDHTAKDGSQPWDRAEDAGYDGNRIGENIAWGYPSAQAVVNGWESSAGHCRNLMNPAYDDIGIAAVGSTSPMWVQVFGG